MPLQKLENILIMQGFHLSKKQVEKPKKTLKQKEQQCLKNITKLLRNVKLINYMDKLKTEIDEW